MNSIHCQIVEIFENNLKTMYEYSIFKFNKNTIDIMTMHPFLKIFILFLIIWIILSLIILPDLHSRMNIIEKNYNESVKQLEQNLKNQINELNLHNNLSIQSIVFDKYNKKK
jgi:Fe2+ transport system protein B